MAPRPGGDGLVPVGVFGAAHGVRGEIRLKSYTGEPAAVGRYGPLRDAGGRRFRLLALRPLKDDLFVARVEGVADRTAAEALVNLALFVERDRLPPPDPGEYYHADLIGLAAEAPDGTPLGRVAALPNYGAGDLVEIAPPDGGETLLVPFTDACVPTIDLPGGRMVVALPESVDGTEA